MVRTKKRLTVCVCLLVVNLVFIWGNSLLPASASGAFSDFVKRMLSAILPGGSSQSSGGGLLRKMAHFTEFACLGLLLSWLCRMLGQRSWQHILLPLAAGVAAAALDETIQMFVPGRGPALKDVGIDTAGVLLGVVIISLITIYKQNKKWRKQT